MKLFRLQTQDNRGPWQGTDFPVELSQYFQASYNAYSHPTPWDDGLREWRKEGIFFSCQSMDLLREWFDPFANDSDPHKQWMRSVDYNELRVNGFKVHVYEVGEGNYKIGYSKRQVAFRKEVARLLEVLPLESLFNTVASV